MNPWSIRDLTTKAGYACASFVGQSPDVRRDRPRECDTLFEEKRSGAADACPMPRQ